MSAEIRKFFRQIINNSLNTQQVNYLGELVDSSFNLNRAAGFSSTMPVPRQTAANTLISYFSTEEEIVNLFACMLLHEGERFYNRDLAIWGRDEFLNLLRKHKWSYDRDLGMFFLDPFYEREINFLKKIRFIDLREKVSVKEIIKELTDITSAMSIADLEWRVVLRLYDLERETGELIRKIITLLLTRQELQMFTSDLFVCLKEMAINASKANYKLLFEKHVTAPEGITADKNYHVFLERFRDEIDENGNSNLFQLARQDDRYITITFQSTIDSIEIWVTNSQNITAVEKQQIIKKLGMSPAKENSFVNDDDELKEGAGLGINLVLRVLRSYSADPHPLKVVFYPEFIKFGFTLTRESLRAKIPEPEPEKEKS